MADLINIGSGFLAQTRSEYPEMFALWEKRRIWAKQWEQYHMAMWDHREQEQRDRTDQRWRWKSQNELCTT